MGLRLRRGRRHGGLCSKDEGVWMGAEASRPLAVWENPFRRRHRA